jgi:hypothetical protein
MSGVLRNVIRLLATSSSHRAWQRHSALLYHAHRQQSRAR